MSVSKGNHCAYDAHYHVVFPVKYRKALLYPHVVRAIQEIAVAITERYEFQFEHMGTDGDHIHILASFHPKWSVATFVQRFKSITARELFRQFPQLRKELWGVSSGQMVTMSPPSAKVVTGRRSYVTSRIKERRQEKPSNSNCGTDAHLVSIPLSSAGGLLIF